MMTVIPETRHALLTRYIQFYQYQSRYLYLWTISLSMYPSAQLLVIRHRHGEKYI